MEYYNLKERKPLIMQLQKKLRSLSRWTEDPALSTAQDGSYDASTADAVRHFQELYGLEVTGITDLETWDTIDREYRYFSEIFGQSRPLFPFPDTPDFSVGQGERSDLVLIIQIMLNELRIFYDTYGYIPPNGRFGVTTQGAVREFQRIGGLTPSGTVDRPTWNRLADEYSLALMGDGS